MRSYVLPAYQLTASDAAHPLRVFIQGPADYHGADYVTADLGRERRLKGDWTDLPDRIQDLLDIAVTVMVADRVGVRHPDVEGNGWPRRFNVDVPVREKIFWQTPDVAESLASLLDDLTGDRWHFEFRGAVTVPRNPIQYHLDLPPSAPRDVALLSGGLDSLAGVCGLLQQRPDLDLTLLSAGSGSAVTGVQRQVYECLRSCFWERIDHVEIPILFRAPIGAERMHRSRLFVFDVLGAIHAHTRGASRLYQLENGVSALCLPLVTGAFDWQVAHGIHPRFLSRMSRLLTMVFGKDFQICNPYLFSTKAQMLTTMRGMGMESAVRVTVSCDRFPRRRAGSKACGICGPCLLRRMSLAASGMSEADDLGEYDHDVLKALTLHHRHRSMVRAVTGQTALLERTLESDQPWIGLVKRFPDLEPTKHHLAATMNVSASDAEGRIISLVRRYVSEWREFPVNEDIDVHVNGPATGQHPWEALLTLPNMTVREV